MITGHEFIFSYMTNKNSVMFDGVNLIIKRGPFYKKFFPFNSIVNWYVYEDKTYRSLFITWNEDSGKLKKIQIFAQLGEPGFADLVDAFNHSIGAKCLNHLPKKEAFKIMKATDPKKVGALGAMIVILILTTSVMYPGLHHFFDFGFEDADVEDVIKGDYGSRNMNLAGYPLEYALEETTTSTKSGSTSSSSKIFIPVVGPEWDYDGPVECMLLFDEDQYNETPEDAIVFKGVLRNIAWEGLDEDERQFFLDEYDLEVADDCLLFEVTGEEHNDAGMFYGWLAINGLFVIIFGIVYVRSK